MAASSRQYFRTEEVETSGIHHAADWRLSDPQNDAHVSADSVCACWRNVYMVPDDYKGVSIITPCDTRNL